MQSRQSIRSFALTLLLLLSSASPQAQERINLEYSVEWSPLYKLSSEVSIPNNPDKHYLINTTFVETNNTISPERRIIEFIAGPFTQKEYDPLYLVAVKKDISTTEIYKKIKHKPLFMIESVHIQGPESRKLYHWQSNPFEIWRLWRPRWVFIANLGKLSDSEQNEFILKKFGIASWN